MLKQAGDLHGVIRWFKFILRVFLVRALVEKSGKLPVRIAAEYDAPVGNNACKLVNQIGVQVRSNLSSYKVKNWKVLMLLLKM